jgi:hypothetical protein
LPEGREKYRELLLKSNAVVEFVRISVSQYVRKAKPWRELWLVSCKGRKVGKAANEFVSISNFSGYGSKGKTVGTADGASLKRCPFKKDTRKARARCGASLRREELQQGNG